MKLNNKEFFKISFLYTAVAAFPPFLNLFVRPLIEGEGKLGPGDFSQIEITETIITLAFIIATFAMNNAISRFYYDYTDNKKGYNKLVSGIFNFILLRGLVLLVIAYVFRDLIGQIFSQPELQDFSKYGFAAIITGMNRAINMTAFALYRNEKKVRRFLILSIILGILRSVFQLIGVFYYDMSFIGYVYGNLIGSSIVTIVILVYTYNKSGFHIDRKILSPVNQFALPLFEYSIIVWGINFADRYFLESAPTALGIYSQALLMGRGIEIILQGLQGASQPEMFRFMKDGFEKNMGEIKKLSHLLMAQSQLIIALAILPAMAYCLIFKTELRLASGLIAIVFIRYIQRMQYTVFSFPVYFEKKTKVFLYLNLVVLGLNLLFLYFLVPLYGIYGAVAAMLITQTIQVFGIFIYQQRLVKISWNMNKVMVYPIIIIILTVLLEIINVQYGLNEFASAAVVVAIIFLSLVLLYKRELINVINELRVRLKF
ncbi:MAG: polysaccharide biosynthesis C-terminal domain-containing protein [Bacteroidales bacterium]|nr:polysaccharide biosynthesis C-terminal domain-containing protein [Bacteroidales bacterium]